MDTQQLTSTVGKFPFVMVLVATFLRGSIFMAVNFPLLTSFPPADSVGGPLALLSKTSTRFWAGAAGQFGEIGLTPVFLFVSLAAGLLITPVDRLLTFLICKLLAAGLYVARFLGYSRRVVLFDGFEPIAVDYPGLLSYFFSEPEKKMHWEWELFQFYIYWGVLLNVVIFTTIMIGRMFGAIGWSGALLLVAFCVLALVAAAARAVVMGQVHGFYLRDLRARSIDPRRG